MRPPVAIRAVCRCLPALASRDTSTGTAGDWIRGLREFLAESHVVSLSAPTAYSDANMPVVGMSDKDSAPSEPHAQQDDAPVHAIAEMP